MGLLEIPTLNSRTEIVEYFNINVVLKKNNNKIYYTNLYLESQRLAMQCP